MEALVELFPNLPEEIHERYGATIRDFNMESMVIHFDGSTTAKASAWTEIYNLLSSANISTFEIHFSASLVPSLRKRLQIDQIQTYVKLRAPLQLTLCSFDGNEHEQAVKLAYSQPIENYVNVALSDIDAILNDQRLKSLEEEIPVSVVKSELEDCKLVVSGFCLDDVQAARKKLISLVRELSKKRQVQNFTTEEVMYLNFQHQNYPDLFSDIPIKFKHGKTVEISGSPEAINKIVNGSLLSALQWKRYSFKCNTRFLQQITSCVLHPLKEDQNLDFVYLTDKPKRVFKQNPARSAENEHFDIVVYSKDPTSFHQVCASLDDIKPMSKRYNFRYRESEQCVKLIKSKLENAYLVRISESERGAYINGLKEDDVQKCWKNIDEEIRSTVVIHKTIPTAMHESRYLKQKYCEELKLDYACDVFFIKDRFEIQVKGKLKDVEAIESRIKEILEAGVQAKTFTIKRKARHFSMWKMRWMNFKKEQERSDIVIDFRRCSSSSPDSESQQSAEVVFEVIGIDSDQLLEIKDTLCNEETEERFVDISSSGVTALLNAKKQGQLKFMDNLALVMNIDKVANRVVLTSPQVLADDLDTAELEIQKFVGLYACVHENLTSDEPVVGLILNSKTRSAAYLATANAVAKQHKVSVHPLRAPLVGLRLTGTPAAIKSVQAFIHTHVLKQIEADIKQLKITINHKQSALLASPEFSRFETKLKEEYCVMCSYPKLGKQSKAVHSGLIQPSSSAHPIQLDICRGSIVYEKVDAIVNAANEDLKHVGGLAKKILDAGGLTIQTQSSKHVQLNGKVVAGTCVALGAGALPCKRIIHAVGPRWVDGTNGEEQTLYFTVYNSLQCADNEKLSSIAFPAIGTGVFGVPENICARASLKAVQEYSQLNPGSSISTVRFVLFSSTSFQAFKSCFKSIIQAAHCIPPATSQPEVDAPPKSKFNSSNSGQWMWANDFGSFSYYPLDIATELTQEYQRNVNGSAQCSINGQSYKIDFATMTQTNVSTGHQRSVRLESSPNQSIQWQYFNDQHSWSPYQPSESQAIEAMYQANSPGDLHILGKKYTFDFTSMCQINVLTNYQRNIQRVSATSPTSVAVEQQPTATTTVMCQKTTANIASDKESSSTKGDLTIVLHGPGDSLLCAKAKIEEKLKFLLKSYSISFPAALEEKLHQIIGKYNVTSSVEEVAKETKGKPGKQQKIIHIEGLASTVQHAVTVIQDEIIRNQLESEVDDGEECPQEWDHQTATTQVFLVQQGNIEWTRVEQLFKKTMPNSTVVQISRIQNRWLWDRYVFQRKRVGVKNGGSINELELFHGTRTNDPKVIYENEDGFDMRYSAQGMWGQANYFAVNASYSNGYAHTTPDGYKEMFLVKVLTGDSYDCPSNGSLRKPPMKSTGASGEVSFAQVQYDTVTGVTGGSRVYMTYDNDKAYPAYLIKYK